MILKKQQALIALSRRLEYRFSNESLLQEAMSHSSLEGSCNNERLEFLGDGVLNLVIAAHISELFPKASEGELSRIRAQLVCKDALAQVGLSLRFGEALLLGPSEARGGSQQRKSIIADAVEAIIGAVFKDADYNQAQSCILRWFQPLLDDLSLDLAVKDAKTQLQEYCQKYKLPLPCYTAVTEHQSAGETYFVVGVGLESQGLHAQGEGTSRKKAEQLAAACILQQLADN